MSGLMERSTWASIDESRILHSTRSELAFNKSFVETMSFCRLDVTMMTSSAAVASATSLMNRYISRRIVWFLDWNSCVTPKKISVASEELKLSPDGGMVEA